MIVPNISSYDLLKEKRIKNFISYLVWLIEPLLLVLSKIQWEFKTCCGNIEINVYDSAFDNPANNK